MKAQYKYKCSIGYNGLPALRRRGLKLLNFKYSTND